MKTYLFYDIETSGLSQCFDQVLQFAAIRTDMELNEITRHEIMIKLNPDSIPSPYAMITHQLNLNDINNGLSEYAAMQQIHALLNQPGTISVGYNTLGFDDEFLRFSFYRNLLKPYTHQYNNQCSRMDIFPITLMYYLYKTDALNWPIKDDKVSLKLENINTANQLQTGQAHNAMVDVAATVELAKRLKKDASMWSYLTAYFNKAEDQKRLLALPKNIAYCAEGILIQSRLGYKNNFQTPVLGLGQHQVYKNQTVWLRLDSPDLQQAQRNNFKEHTRTINKKLGEAEFILPPTERFLKKLAPERLALAEENKNWLATHPDILSAIAEYYCQYTYPLVPEVDCDAALYVNDFWTDDDVRECQIFHHANNKSEALDNMRNPNLKDLALRIIGRNFPEQLSAEQKELFDQHMEKAFSDQPPISFKAEARYRMTQAKEDIKKLKENQQLTSHQHALLGELENYLLSLN